jgi:hypothetical protein
MAGQNGEKTGISGLKIGIPPVCGHLFYGARILTGWEKLVVRVNSPLSQYLRWLVSYEISRKLVGALCLMNLASRLMAATEPHGQVVRSRFSAVSARLPD